VGVDVRQRCRGKSGTQELRKERGSWGFSTAERDGLGDRAANPRCYSGIRPVKPGLGLKGRLALSSQLEKGRFILQSAQEILFFGNA